MRKCALLCLTLIWLPLLGGCGSSSISSIAPPTSTPSLSSIAVTSATGSIAVGQLEQLTATATYSDGSTKNVTSSVVWSSSSSSIATVSKSGLVTAVAAGQAKIVAALDSINGSKSFSVTDTLLSISINPASPTMNVGSTLQLTALGSYQDKKPPHALGVVSWSSSASTVASVTQTGLITGLKGGTAVITAAQGTISTSVQITVSPVLVSVVASSNVYSTNVGSTLQFNAIANYNDGSLSNVTSSAAWTSSATTIATISSSGLLKALAAGSTKIQATYEGIIGSAIVTVNASHSGPVLKSISVTPNPASVAVNSPISFTATGTYSDGSSKNISASVTWSSSASTIAIAGSSGVVVGSSAGQANITATSGSISGSASLTVTDSLLSLSISSSANTVNVGSALQLTAMGTYQDGKPPRAVSGVTWTSSAIGLASVNNSGVVAGLKGGNVTITASAGSLSSSIQLSVAAVLQAIVLSPTGPALVVGGHQQFHALGAYNDGSTQDLTATAQWSPSDAGKASIAAGGLASAVSAGLVTISASSAGVTGSTALNVVNSVYAAFTGPYAFSLTAISNQGAAFFAGSITADAQGNITGVEDSNGPGGVQQNVAVTGTSIIYPDGRGVLVFNPNACHPSGITLRFLLTSGGSSGSLIQFDGRGGAKGSLALQNPAAFNAAALNGTYVFRAAGLDSGNNSTNVPQPLGVIGMFAANGAGSVTSGTEDINDFGTVSLLLPLSTSSYTVGANGRGTLQLTNASGTSNYAAYVIDSTRFYLIETDAAPANAVLGQAELQTAQLYDASSLSGFYAFQLDQPVQVNGGGLNYFNFEQIGRFDLDGAGNMGGLRDGESMTGGYNVSNNAVNGRGMLSTQGMMPGQTTTDYRLYLFYVVSPAKVYMLQCYSLPSASALTPAIGEAELQTGAPYGTSTLSGSYAMTAFDMTVQTESLMWLNFDGTGNIQGIADVGGNGSAVSTVIANPQFLSSPQLDGFTSVQLTTSIGTQAYAFYLVSPSTARLGTLNPPMYGSLDQQ